MPRAIQGEMPNRGNNPIAPLHDRPLIVAATVTAIATYALVGLGSTVRVTHSGMGCPSWPLCYSQLGPIYRLHPILEESHRYLASIVTVLSIVTLMLSRKPGVSVPAKRFAKLAVGLVLFQVFLGGLTVLAKNAPWTVAAHLITGFVYLGVTTATAVFAHQNYEITSLSLEVKLWGGLSLLSTLLLFLSGSIVVGSGAGAICDTWPVCFANGPGGLTAIALFHRVMMGTAGLFILTFLSKCYKSASRPWRRRSWLLLVLLGFTVLVGAIVAISKSEAFWADIHLALGALVWVTLVVQVLTHLTIKDNAINTSFH